MSDQPHDHFSHHVRRYLFVFYALLFGTLLTVAASYIPFGVRSINIAVALLIAVCKAPLVTCPGIPLLIDMSLKTFHVIFISAASALGFGCGVWGLKNYWSAQGGV